MPDNDRTEIWNLGKMQLPISEEGRDMQTAYSIANCMQYVVTTLGTGLHGFQFLTGEWDFSLLYES
jgi:hypothetical protein